MSTQIAIKTETNLPEYGTTQARLVKIISRPTKENDYWCDFLWENAEGNREARCLQITHAQIDYMGYVTEEYIDDFAPEGLVLTRGRIVEYAKEMNELINYELSCIITHFQDCHEPSDFFVAKRVLGRRGKHSQTFKRYADYVWNARKFYAKSLNSIFKKHYA